MRGGALLLAFLAGPIGAQSAVAFPPDVYAARRARLVAELPGATIIMPGRHLIGAHELPRQDPNFWYLTGVESPLAVLVISPDTRPGAAAGAVRTALFLPDSFQFAGAQFPHVDSSFRRAPWNIPQRRLSAGAAARAATGIAETYRLDEFDARLRELVGGARTVYLPALGESVASPGAQSAPAQRSLALGSLLIRSPEAQITEAIVTALGVREFRELTPVIRRMRLVKDAHEIAALRTAARISAESMVALMRAMRPGMNDLEAAGLLEYEWKRNGAHRSAFAPIIGSGPNSMSFFTVMGENYDAVGRTMRAGELLFVDYGAAEFSMYTSDICRTFPVSGRFSEEQRKYYDIVLEAQEAAISRIKPGVMMLDVIRAAAEVFRRHGLEAYEDPSVMGTDRVWGVMPSPTHYLKRGEGITRYSRYGAGVRDIGHHIGLEVTDSRDWTIPLAAGMVITIEPKLYIPEKQIAIMIEDMILVTPTGAENLSAAAPKRATEIETIMRGSARR